MASATFPQKGAQARRRADGVAGEIYASDPQKDILTVHWRTSAGFETRVCTSEVFARDWELTGKPVKSFRRLLNSLLQALLAGNKKHDLKLKPKRKPTAHARHTPHERAEPSNTSNVDIWHTVSPWAKKAARERGATLVGKGSLQEGEPDGQDDGPNPYAKWEITENTRNSLRGLVIKAIAKGWTVNQLQHEIIMNEKFSAACALTIAWTETALAHSHGNHESARSIGMKFKSWITSQGGCEACQTNANQGRILIDEPFQSGVDCPPAHTHCRCAAGYYESKYERK
jgi:Phage Mu protein F like protein